jgi:hypothetical protein
MRGQQMMAHPIVRNASWMSSRISPRMRRRRNQRGRAMGSWRGRPSLVRPQCLLRAAGQEVTVDWASYPEFASSSSAGPSSATPNLDRP